MKIFVGVTTYNRKKTVEMMASSFLKHTCFDDIDLYIFDDASTEYGVEYLKEVFPKAKKINKSVINRKADLNIRMMNECFLDSDCDILFNCDSDLIFSEGWLEKSLSLFNQTDGFLSVFNTYKHPSIESYSDDIIIKAVVGSAGCFVNRDIVEKVLKNVPSGKNRYDWEMCRYLNSAGIRIMCSKISYVQHIGFGGQNSRGLFFDYGMNFTVSDTLNAQILETCIEEHFQSLFLQKDVYMRKLAENFREYRLGVKLFKIFPFLKQ